LARKNLLAWVLLLLLTQSMVGCAANTFPKDKPTIYVDPSEMIDLPPSSTFTVTVKIHNITGLYGYDLKFRWNPSILSYVSHTVHAKWTLKLKDDPYPTEGWYWIAYSKMLPDVPFSGNLTVFSMTFHVVGVGRCYLGFDSTDLADQDGFPIDHYVQPGYFCNSPPPTPAKIGVVPKTIVNADLTPCNYFSVNITIQNVTDLHSFEFKLGYNTTILDCSAVTEGDFLKSAGPAAIDAEFDEENGRLRVNASLLDPSGGASGSGVLATIVFHVADVGESVLDLYDVILINSEGEEHPLEPPEDGYFNNRLIAKISVYPHELIDPTMKPGDFFQIHVQIGDVIDMYDYAFSLGYDTNVLTCLGAVVVPPTNDTSFDVKITVNDAEGYLSVDVQYYPPAAPITIYEPKTVVIVFFMIQSYGQSVLDLYDTRLSNPYGGLITHEVNDGFFATLLRDVAITNVRIVSQNVVYPGRIVVIEVEVMNRGNMTTETFDVTVYYDNNPIETRSVTLGPWSKTTLTFYWNTSGLMPCNNFTISARASPVPYEINLENNIFVDGWVKIKMRGDVNGNGIVDIYDVVAVASIYGVVEGDPSWNPDCDLAPPWGLINIYDVVTVCALYGQTC